MVRRAQVLRRYVIIFLIVTFIFRALPLPIALADDWSVDPARMQLKEEVPNKPQTPEEKGQGESAEHKITKFCGENGEQVYSNVGSARYKPCGSVATQILCDAEGRKYIGKDKPNGYMDCSVINRIQISGEFVERRKAAMAELKNEIPDSVHKHVEKKLGQYAKETERHSITPSENKQDLFGQLDSLLQSANGGPASTQKSMQSYSHQITELSDDIH